MDWVPLAVAVLFVGPLWATGELGVYSFAEPRSHLVWDEAMGAEPQPVDEPGGTPMLVVQLAAGLLLVLAVVVWPRRSS
jgi:hypothetical protein